MLPGIFLYPGLRRSWSKQIHLKTGDIASQLQHQTKSKPLDIQLDESFFLTRRVNLPLVPRKKIGEALRLDLLRTSPDRLEDLHWVSPTNVRTPATVTQHVVRKSKIDELKSAITAAGFKIRTIAAAPCRSEMIYDNRRSLDRPVAMWWSAIFLMFFGAVAYFTYNKHLATTHLAQMLEIQKKQNIEFRDELAARLAQDEEFTENNTHYEALARKIQIALGRAQFIASLSAELPDDTWLPSLSLAGNVATLGVVTGETLPKLTERLQQLQLVNSVTPITPAALDRRTGLSRVDLRLVLGYE